MARATIQKRADAERDGFASLLGAFGRQIDRDVKSGSIAAETGELIKRRIGTMVEYVGLGLHLTHGGDRL